MRRSLLAPGLAIFLCVVVLASVPAKAVERREALSAAARSAKAVAAPDFAIADFDGDAKPDLATVQPGAALAARTSYWIHFAFSAVSERSIAVLAPTGGLQIASRDVNGDSFLDLVVSTRLANEPVAVLLNDGRGNFHLADVRAFSAAIWARPVVLRGCAEPVGDPDAAMGNAGWSFAGLLPSASCASSPTPAEALARPCVRENVSAVARAIRGRAPPLA
jgi:hypothetical protein